MLQRACSMAAPLLLPHQRCPCVHQVHHASLQPNRCPRLRFRPLHFSGRPALAHVPAVQRIAHADHANMKQPPRCAASPSCASAASSATGPTAGRAPVPGPHRRVLGVVACCLTLAGLLSLWPVAAATAAAAAAAAPSTSGAAPLTIVGPGGLMVGVGVCVIAVAFSVLVFFAVPTMLAWRRTANAMALLARVAAQEVPETAAAVRLGGLEVTDAVQELGLLGSDLTAGVRSGAASMEAAQASVRGGAAAARVAVTGHLLPAMRRRMPAVRGAAEAAVQRRAAMTPALSPDVRAAARSAGHAAKQARAIVAGADLASKAGTLVAQLHQRAPAAPQQQRSIPKAAASMDPGA